MFILETFSERSGHGNSQIDTDTDTDTDTNTDTNRQWDNNSQYVILLGLRWSYGM